MLVRLTAMNKEIFARMLMWTHTLPLFISLEMALIQLNTRIPVLPKLYLNLRLNKNLPKRMVRSNNFQINEKEIEEVF